MNLTKKVLKTWLPLALVVTALCALVYLSIQQSLRQGANDPQIQMANDAADSLTSGVLVDVLLPAGTVEISRSLAPFLVIFNDTGEVQGATGLLHGQNPVIPPGVLDYTRQKGEDRVTWQPEAGVRIAAVVVRVGGAHPGFVLAGRSLREVEKRVDQVQTFTGAAWLATLVASLVLVILLEWVLGGKKLTGG
jgi:hypothetical protein